jgi:hypothetical protein
LSRHQPRYVEVKVRGSEVSSRESPKDYTWLHDGCLCLWICNHVKCETVQPHISAQLGGFRQIPTAILRVFSCSLSIPIGKSTTFQRDGLTTSSVALKHLAATRALVDSVSMMNTVAMCCMVYARWSPVSSTEVRRP